jgi:hypothetical protein
MHAREHRRSPGCIHTIHRNKPETSTSGPSKRHLANSKSQTFAKAKLVPNNMVCVPRNALSGTRITGGGTGGTGSGTGSAAGGAAGGRGTAPAPDRDFALALPLPFAFALARRCRKASAQTLFWARSLASCQGALLEPASYVSGAPRKSCDPKRPWKKSTTPSEHLQSKLGV